MENNKSSSVQKNKSNTNANIHNYSGFWHRTAAFLIDAVIMSILGILIWMLLGSPPLGSFIIKPIVWVISFIFSFSYNTFLTWQNGGTLGKIIVGIRVSRSNTSMKLTYGRAVIRYFAFFISFIPLYVGLIIQPFTKRKQALHDLIADTIVEDIKKRSSSHIWGINIFCFVLLTLNNIYWSEKIENEGIKMPEIVNQADSHKETNWILLGVYEGSDPLAPNVIFKVSVLYDQKIIKNGNITKANLKETIFNQTNKTDDGYITYEAEYDCNSMEQRKFNAAIHPSHNSVYVSKVTLKDFEKTSTLQSQEGINALKLHFCN